MSDDARDLSGLEEAVGEHRGVRVWSVTGPSQQALVDRGAVLLGEHMDDGDELHVTYAVVQNGSQDRSRPRIFREPETWTELYFEYSALLVLRAQACAARQGCDPGPTGPAPRRRRAPLAVCEHAFA